MNHLSKRPADEGEFNLFWVDELKNVNFRCAHGLAAFRARALFDRDGGSNL